MTQNKQPVISTGVSFWMTFGFTVFVMMTILISITPVFLQFGRMIACPGAQEYTLTYQDGGVITKAGSPNKIGTSTVGLTCTFADGSKKVVENDPLFLYSAAGAFMVSVLAGGILGGWSVWRNRSARG